MTASANRFDSEPTTPTDSSGRFGRLWRSFVALTSEKETGDSLAIFRCFVGFAYLLSLGTVLRRGLVDVIWVDVKEGGMVHLGQGNRLLAALGGPTHANVWLLFWIALAAGIFFTVGLGGRVSAFIALQTYQALYSNNGLTSHGYDVLITNALWLCVLGDATRTLSLDCRRKTGQFSSDELVNAWPRTIGVLQIIVVYVTTGLQKLSPVWTPAGGYSALYWVLQDPDWRRYDFRWTASVYPLTQIATAITWNWEVFSPLMLLAFFYRRTRERKGRLRRLFNRFDLRIPFLAIGLVLHLGIFLAMNVGEFSLIAVSFYVLFFRPDEVRAASLRGRAFIFRSARASDSATGAE